MDIYVKDNEYEDRGFWLEEFEGIGRAEHAVSHRVEHILKIMNDYSLGIKAFNVSFTLYVSVDEPITMSEFLKSCTPTNITLS